MLQKRVREHQWRPRTHTFERIAYPNVPSPHRDSGTQWEKMTAPAAVRGTQQYDATHCGLWPELVLATATQGTEQFKSQGQGRVGNDNS